MVGLSVVLETTKNPMRYSAGVISPKPPHVLNKTAVMISSSAAVDISGFRRESSCTDPGFLENCSLCRKKLLSGKDIYMYKGGTFCTQECRSRQIFMDEEESSSGKNCSLVAIKTTPSHSSSSTSSSASYPSPASDPGGYSPRRRGPRNRAGGFAY